MARKTPKDEKMGLNATWSMAVGGMVGGGIFSVLGVVIAAAGEWAWLSFVLAGLIALATGHSYVELADKFGEGGGAFTFLREVNHQGLAGGLSWILVMGYTLTIAVYAFTFGHYLGAVFGGGPWAARIAALAVVAVLTGVNLMGVGEASWLEIITVWAKLAVLLGLAVIGLWTFSPPRLVYPVADPGGGFGVIVGAASIFMAYEGFQLLTYDYDDIRNPKQTLRRGVMWAIGSVIAIYVLVTLGSASLVGSAKLIEHKEIALAQAGKQAMGMLGLVLVSIAAAFSTGSAINATLFATARLSKRVADDGELPAYFARENAHGIPDRSVISLGVAGATLAVAGGLEQLVSTASLAFLFTFATVNLIAARQGIPQKWISWAGAIGAAAAGCVLTVRLAWIQPVALGATAIAIAIVLILRPAILRRLHTATSH